MRKVAHHQISGVLHLLSGLRIGGSDEALEIGGADLTCIKHPGTLEPYIPGSSIKGKMRSELEHKFGLAEGSQPFSGTKKIKDGNRDRRVSLSLEELTPEQYLLASIFGPHMNPDHKFGPTRIIARDAPLAGDFRLEVKTENAIDRETGTALKPRQQERVAAGAEFKLKIGLQVWDLDDNDKCAIGDRRGAEAMIEFVRIGLQQLQLTGLGAGVSTGSGEIEIRDLKVDDRPLEL
jgi:CRISPR-associated protein Csm3